MHGIGLEKINAYDRKLFKAIEDRIKVCNMPVKSRSPECTGKYYKTKDLQTICGLCQNWLQSCIERNNPRKVEAPSKPKMGPYTLTQASKITGISTKSLQIRAGRGTLKAEKMMVNSRLSWVLDWETVERLKDSQKSKMGGV